LENINNQLVSIGLPVFNGHPDVEDCINSIVNQTYKNIEIIISDNCSTDLTSDYCYKKSLEDKRIKFFRQNQNIGGDKNFEFVFKKSTGDFFMWISHDDIISHNYIKENITVLEKNRDCVYSSGINYFKGKDFKDTRINTFNIKGDSYLRFKTFLNYCWHSHGCFYSLIKKKSLDDFNFYKSSVIGIDWIINMHLLSKGNYYRSLSSHIIISSSGTSSSKKFFFPDKKIRFKNFFPLKEFNSFFYKKISLQKFKIINKIFLLYNLYIVNINMTYKILKKIFK
tara:strand:+ start:457 stop:1302 length:846 start_codon:yes stop_codon:yes gene_type:complete